MSSYTVDAAAEHMLVKHFVSLAIQQCENNTSSERESAHHTHSIGKFTVNKENSKLDFHNLHHITLVYTLCGWFIPMHGIDVYFIAHKMKPHRS